MKIGINGYEAVVPRFGFDKKTGLPNRVGSGEVCFQWLTWLSRIDKKNKYVIYLPTKPTKDLPSERDNWHYEIIPSRKLWTILGLSRRLRTEQGLDVFLSPSHYAPLFSKTPQVITILDVSYKYYPQFFNKIDLYKLALWGQHSVKRAQKVITISESSKDDIMEMYHVPSRKVVVSHLGIKESLRTAMPKEELLQQFSISTPYILFVGTLQPRKNIRRLIEAFSKVRKKHDGHQLVIVGKKGWQYEDILSAPREFEIKDSVVFLHNVAEDELPGLYKNAEVFVLPSLYEGFGLPVLEAMKFGCPVITSNISSLPEAGGDAAEYVDPNDVDSIAGAIEKVLSDKKLQDKMKKRGEEHYKKFTWENSAKKVLETLEEVGRHE